MSGRQNHSPFSMLQSTTGSRSSGAEGDEDLDNMDPARLQMLLDDIETGWAFDHSGGQSKADSNMLLDQSGSANNCRVCQVECDCIPDYFTMEGEEQQSPTDKKPLQVQFRNIPNHGIEQPSPAGLDDEAQESCGSDTGGGKNSNEGLSLRSVSRHSLACHSTSGHTHATVITGLYEMIPLRVSLISIFLFLLGMVAMSVIFGMGLSAEAQKQNLHFEVVREALVHQMEKSLYLYLKMGLMLHQATAQPTMNHESFSIFYDYVKATSPPSPSCGIALHVDSYEERRRLENDTRAYLLEQFPDAPYSGIWQYSSSVDENQNVNQVQNPLYYPVHFLEPLEDPLVREIIDLDLISVSELEGAIAKAVQFQQPAVSPLISLVPYQDHTFTEGESWEQGNRVILVHPGLGAIRDDQGGRQRTDNETVVDSLDVSLVTIKISDILETLNALELEKTVSVYLYDSTDESSLLDSQPEGNNQITFLGGAKLHKFDVHTKTQRAPEFLPAPDDLAKLEASFEPFFRPTPMPIATREWKLIVAVEEEELPFQPQFIFLAGFMIFFACCFLSLGILLNQYRMAKMNQERSAAEKDRMILKIKNARKQARQERALNDFLAHEVRNPLSAAISATSFVYAAIHDGDNDKLAPLLTAEKRKAVLNDVIIIDSSLHFANDLLRNMLDMHRAATNQLNVEFTPVDLLHDVLEPVANMLYTRDADYEVQIECNPPNGLIVMSDRLRLKQMVLNLARNSTKFVQKGFLRLTAAVGTDNMVYLSIEDSGPGIPEEKKKALFQKYQESLDSLNQGTGIGLSLCKKFMALLGGEIWLDEQYNSGIEGSPGARFVISLEKRPLSDDVVAEHTRVHLLKESALRNSMRQLVTGRQTDPIASDSSTGQNAASESAHYVLPDALSVLFVDDDAMLRKLFSRSLKRLMPEWKIREASNGETALRLVESDEFDIIFMDQYMSSTEKQLLGTETVRNLRAKGVTGPIVCGLSANDIEQNFLKNGADAFLIKPLPCKNDELTNALFKLLRTRGDKYQNLARKNDSVAMSAEDSCENVATMPRLPLSERAGEENTASLNTTPIGVESTTLTAKEAHAQGAPEVTPQVNVAYKALSPPPPTAARNTKTSPLFSITLQEQLQCTEGTDAAPLKPPPLFKIAPEEGQAEAGTAGERIAPTPQFNVAIKDVCVTPTDMDQRNAASLFNIEAKSSSEGPDAAPRPAPLFNMTPKVLSTASNDAATPRPAPLFSIESQIPSSPASNAAVRTSPAPLFNIAPGGALKTAGDAGSLSQAPLFNNSSRASCKPSQPNGAPLFNISSAPTHSAEQLPTLPNIIAPQLLPVEPTVQPELSAENASPASPPQATKAKAAPLFAISLPVSGAALSEGAKHRLSQRLSICSQSILPAPSCSCHAKPAPLFDTIPPKSLSRPPSCSESNDDERTNPQAGEIKSRVYPSPASAALSINAPLFKIAASTACSPILERETTRPPPMGKSRDDSPHKVSPLRDINGALVHESGNEAQLSTDEAEEEKKI